MDNATLATPTHTHDEDCEPTEAWVEKIEHPAVGEPTIIVDNPDYVAPTYTPKHTIWIDPVYTPGNGEPETIEVEQDNPDYVPATDEQTVESGFVKWNWTGGPIDYTPAAPGGTDDWGWHNVGHSNDSKGSSPDVVHQGNGKASFFYYETAYETIPAQPAQGEPTITVTIDNPEYVAPTYTPGYEKEVPASYTPAEGKPTIEVDNPDYIEAWVEDIHHDATVCEVADTASPGDGTPGETGGAVQTSGPTVPKAVETAATTQQAPDAPQLAVTGGSDALMPILLAAAALAAGVGLMARKIVRRG